MPRDRRRALRIAIPAAGLAVASVAGVLVSQSSRPGSPLTSRVCQGDVVVPRGLPPPSTGEEGAARPAPLDLHLDTDGSVGSMRVGERTLPALAGGGGFSLRIAGNGPNLVRNGSFELDDNGDGLPDGWSFARRGNSPRLDGGTGHSGARSIRVVNPARQDSGTFRTQVSVLPGTEYVFSAWFRSQNVRPNFPTAVRETYQPHSPLKIDVQQVDGSKVVRTSSAWAYTGTAGWNRQFAGIRTGANVNAVRIVGWIEDGSGTGWLDDLYLGRLFPHDPTPVRGEVSRESGGRTIERATMATLGSDLTTTFTTASDHVRVDGEVKSYGKGDRAFQLSYTLPVAAGGWQWEDFARRTRTIDRGRYAYLSTSSLQQVSRYPWGVIHDDRSALAIGVPLDQPRVFRITYDTAAGLSITFDLGTSPDATALQSRATFSFVVYTADPAWGFRSATQRYYDLFPGSFVRRMNPRCEGAWFVAPPLDSIGRTYLDFGLGLNMIALGKASSQSHATWGARYLGWDNSRHIAATAYTHEWAFYDPVKPGVELTYEQAIAHAGAEATRRPSNPERRRLRNEATAALASTERDYNGRLYYERFGNFYAYYQNLDSASPSRRDWAEAVQVEQVERAIDLAAKSGGRLDGIHLDSTSGMRRWGAVDDYDRGHWAAARIPLTFSYDSGQVAVRGIFPMYDRISQLAGFVGDRGMLLTANFNAAETQALGFVGADRIDFFGLEQGLADRSGPGMSTDQFAMLKRTLAYQRPVSTLDHQIGQGKLSGTEIELRLQQNLFYGIYAGAFDAETEADANGSEATWSTPENAKLWARYAPLTKEVAVAGWQPVTDASSSNPDVWVERYGSMATYDLHFTLRNDTKEPQRLTLMIDLGALGANGAEAVRATEMITGASLQVVFDDQTRVATLTASIPATSTRVLSVSAGQE